MIKKITAFLALLILLPATVFSLPAQAAADFSVKTSSVETAFPSGIVFRLDIESGAEITDVRLHYTVDRMSLAKVTSEIYIEVEPAREITAQWSWDMRKTGGLPPGTTINYWWSMKNAAGKTMTTAITPLLYEDDRFDWKSIHKENITLWWYDGNNDFAEQLLAASLAGLNKLYETTGVDFVDPVDLYIYGNASDLQNAMIFPQTWTGGVAYPAYGCIAIGIQPANLDWGLRTVVHELTHLVSHRLTDNPYLDLPTWLDEGLSMVMEGPLTDNFLGYLKLAVENDALISVQSLSSPFSAYASESYLSYGESYMIVDFMIRSYGREKMLDLLNVLDLGTAYDAALQQVYGFDLSGLNTRFMKYMKTADLDSTGINTFIIGSVYPIPEAVPVLQGI